jgi:signal transduction histidine kinase
LFTRNNTLTLFLSAVVLTAIFYLSVYSIKKFNSEDQIAKRFQESFLDQQSVLEKKIPEVITVLKGEEEKIWPKLERILNENQILAQIYRNDTLLFWNNNRIESNISYLKKVKNNVVLFSQTGWYLTENQSYKEYSISLFKVIKSEYSVNNAYLPVAIQNTFSNYKNIELTLDTVHAKKVIFDREGKAVLGLNIQQPITLSKLSIVLLFSLFILIYLVVLFWIHALYLQFASQFRSTRLLFLFFIVDVIILRFFDYFFGFPDVLKESFLFEAGKGGWPGFASTGDMLINSILLLFIAVSLLRFIRNVEKKELLVKEYRITQRTFLVFLTWALSFAVFLLIYHIVKQTPYSPYFALLFESFDGIANLITVLVLILALFITIHTISPYLVVSKNVLSGLFVAVVLLFTMRYFTFFNPIPNAITFNLIVSAVFLFLVLIVMSFHQRDKKIATEKYLLFLVIFAATTAVVVNSAEKKVRDTHQLKAISFLGQTHQEDLENAYGNIRKKIQHDTVVQHIVMTDDIYQDQKLMDYLNEKYFTGFWTKYDIQLTICGADEQLEIQPENILTNCDDYFSGLIDDFGEPTNDTDLILLNADPESIYYLGLIELGNNDDTSLTQRIYLELFYTIVPKGLGYPELLVDQNISNVDLTAYSFARYEKDKLVYKFGSFAYHTNLRYLDKFPEHSFFNFLNYRHYKIEDSSGNYLIVSRPKVLLTERISTFSILILVFSFVLFLRILWLFGSHSKTSFNFNFQTRLQSVFTGSIAFIILLLAVITMYYVRSNREKNLTDQLNEKTYSVLIELQHKLGGDANLKNYNEEALFNLLRKFSLVFFSDINLYNSSGRLLASSRPEIFEKGLLSENINPQAYEELFVDNRLFYLAEEEIGKLTYYSSYVPLILDRDKPSGIINLPYFARQNEVRQSYIQMLFTFINLFVILGIIGIFIALILSRVLTRPLKVLQKSLANIRIDKQNEKIKWNKNDEIGKLIEEYNRMIDKLEQSAELLKHSERESAWREVARQIAHEIKNPLTPMKLNVQYLEKAYREKDADFDTKMKNISASLIEQIESLNNVAEMFADFSKSTTQHLKKVDLLAIIRSSVELFQNNRNIKIKVVSQSENVITLASADGNDLLRVFNNLLKNSIQSITATTGGKIDISVTTGQQWHIVSISDNGKGIDIETKNLIFQPYFTTKSGGTGLGLAIVKSIMSGIGGQIEFESEPGKGSVFTLKFKAVN